MMMKTMEKPLLRSGASWEATFPYEPVGEKSRPFLQRVVFIAASHILYSRALIPAGCFKKRRMDKLVFYVVRSEGVGESIVRSLKSVLEAIEFGYVRDFIIMVADRAREDQHEALEVHRMSFFYEQDKPQMIIESTKGEKVSVIKYAGVSQAQKQFYHLIRRITAFGNVMGPLPHNVCTTFKLTYYEEKTPPDYEPQGFTADDDLFHFPNKIEFLNHGRLDCQKHMLATSVASIFMKSAAELKSMMQVDIAKGCAASSHGTTVCSSPTKTLRMLSTRTDEFSEGQPCGVLQRNDPMFSIASHWSVDGSGSGTLRIDTSEASMSAGNSQASIRSTETGTSSQASQQDEESVA